MGQQRRHVLYPSCRPGGLREDSRTIREFPHGEREEHTSQTMTQDNWSFVLYFLSFVSIVCVTLLYTEFPQVHTYSTYRVVFLLPLALAVCQPSNRHRIVLTIIPLSH